MGHSLPALIDAQHNLALERAWWDYCRDLVGAQQADFRSPGLSRVVCDFENIHCAIRAVRASKGEELAGK